MKAVTKNMLKITTQLRGCFAMLVFMIRKIDPLGIATKGFRNKEEKEHTQCSHQNNGDEIWNVPGDDRITH